MEKGRRIFARHYTVYISILARDATPLCSAVKEEESCIIGPSNWPHYSTTEHQSQARGHGGLGLQVSSQKCFKLSRHTQIASLTLLRERTPPQHTGTTVYRYSSYDCPKEAVRVLMGADSYIASRANSSCSGSAFRLFTYTCVKQECLLLRCMLCRRGLTMRIILSVRLSVCQTRELWLNGWKINADFLHHTKKHLT